MPTDIATPEWVCDVCEKRYGENRDLAVACEKSGVPESLAVGDVVMNPYTFALDPITDVRGPRAASGGTWSVDNVGHIHAYYIAGASDSVPSTALVPHVHGHVNLRWLSMARAGHSNSPRSSWPGADRVDQDEMAPVLSIANRLGFVDVNNVDYWDRHLDKRRISSVTGPLTPEIIAAFAAVGIGPPEPVKVKSYTADPWTAAFTQAVIDGEGRSVAAVWHLLGEDFPALIGRLNDQRARWFAGEPLTVPAPRWYGGRRSGRAMRTSSSLTKPMRAAVEATGVEWELRTNAHEWANKVVRSLEVEMDEHERLFPIRTVAVCGGKGGVGKSTVAAALAVAAGKTGSAVLVDLDVTNPSQAVLWQLDTTPEVDLERRLMRPTEVAPGAHVLSVGQFVKPGEPVLWSAGTIERWIEFCAGGILLDDVTLVVLDLPPGHTPLHEHLGDHVDMWVHVTTGHPMSLDATARLLGRLDDYRHTPQLLVENLSHRVVAVDGDARTVRVFGDDEGAPTLAKIAGVTLVGSLPYIEDVVELAGTDDVAQLLAAISTTENQLEESDGD